MSRRIKSGFSSPAASTASKGMRYCPVALSPNGRVKPDFVLVNGKQERQPEGAYYLECGRTASGVWLSVGKDAQDAASRRQRKEARA